MPLVNEKNSIESFFSIFALPGGIQRDEFRKSTWNDVTNGQICDFWTWFFLN